MCEHGTETIVSVKIAADLSCDGQEKWKGVGIDACIAPLVAALQAGGIDMRGSCCGHGIGSGHIDLQDGRGLLILSAEDNVRFLTREPVETVKYPCGCSASGPNVPKWCPEHGIPPDVVCQHGTAMDVHCCNCHSGFLFDADSCVCVAPAETQEARPLPERHPRLNTERARLEQAFCEGSWSSVDNPSPEHDAAMRVVVDWLMGIGPEPVGPGHQLPDEAQPSPETPATKLPAGTILGSHGKTCCSACGRMDTWDDCDERTCPVRRPETPDMGADCGVCS